MVDYKCPIKVPSKFTGIHDWTCIKHIHINLYRIGPEYDVYNYLLSFYSKEQGYYSFALEYNIIFSKRIWSTFY